VEKGNYYGICCRCGEEGPLYRYSGSYYCRFCLEVGAGLDQAISGGSPKLLLRIAKLISSQLDDISSQLHDIRQELQKSQTQSRRG